MPAAYRKSGNVWLQNDHPERRQGGVGRSTLSRNFLVSSALAGFRTVGFDMDRQATLHKWHVRREKTRETTDCPATDVRRAALSDWRAIVADSAGFQIAVVDTAPGIEENMASMIELCRAASLVVVPSGVTHDDIESVVPWMRTLRENRLSAAFVLNKANRRLCSFELARTTLLRCGNLCPVEIPTLEDIHSPAANGLCSMDFTNAKGGGPMEGVWTYVQREIDL